MPLARIFTRNPERTIDLSRQLQQQGYKVEVVGPDQAHLAPADLEIEFEMCERTDVLERAASLATELEADVAVASGVLQSAPEPIIEQTAQSAALPAAENIVQLSPPQNLQPDQEREFEAAFSFRQEISPDTPAVIEIPVMEQAPLPPVAFLDDSTPLPPVRIVEKPSVPVPVHFSEPDSEPANSADPSPYLAHLTPFSSPPTRQEMPQASSAAGHSEKASPAQDRYRQVLQEGTKIAARTWAGTLAITSSAAASLRDHFHEYKKQAQVRSAEARAARTARLLDLEQRQAEAQHRAAELEAARLAASVRLEELLKQRSPGLYEESQREQNQHEHGLWQPSTYARSMPKEDSSREVPPAPASVRRTPPIPPQPPKSNRPAFKATPVALWQKVNPPLRAVLTGSAAVSALFIMGIALGLFHSRAPLANPATHAANGVTVQGGGVTVQTGGAAQASDKPQPATGPQSAAAKMQSAAKPSPRVQRTQQLVAQQTESAIGDDVVIRHFSRPAPTQKPKQTGQQAGLKHFSDLDN